MINKWKGQNKLIFISDAYVIDIYREKCFSNVDNIHKGEA